MIIEEKKWKWNIFKQKDLENEEEWEPGRPLIEIGKGSEKEEKKKSSPSDKIEEFEKTKTQE